MIVVQPIRYAATARSESGTAAPAPPTLLDEVGVKRSIRLVRADPGALRRPERARSRLTEPEPAPAVTPIGTFDSEG